MANVTWNKDQHRAADGGSKSLICIAVDLRGEPGGKVTMHDAVPHAVARRVLALLTDIGNAALRRNAGRGPKGPRKE